MFSRFRSSVLMILCLLLVLCFAVSASAESWACPQCGRIGNTNNTCKGCGLARPGQYLAEMTPSAKAEGLADNRLNRHYSFDEDYQRDILGNTFETVLYPYETLTGYCRREEDAYYEYALNGEFTSLTGTLYLPYPSRGIDAPEMASMFKVYADGRLIYEAPDFRKGVFDPVTLELDITGCQTLRIVMLGMGREHYDWLPMVAAGNLTVR